MVQKQEIKLIQNTAEGALKMKKAISFILILGLMLLVIAIQASAAGADTKRIEIDGKYYISISNVIGESVDPSYRTPLYTANAPVTIKFGTIVPGDTSSDPNAHYTIRRGPEETELLLNKEITFTGKQYLFFSYAKEGYSFALEIIEGQASKNKNVSNQAKLSLTDWSKNDTGHIVYYRIKNELSAKANEHIIDTSRYALILYSPDLFSSNLSAEVHFLKSQSLSEGESIGDSFQTQFAGDYVINQSIKAVLVKFDSDKEQKDFKAGIPMKQAGYDYLIDENTNGQKWLKDSFNITLK